MIALLQRGYPWLPKTGGRRAGLLQNPARATAAGFS
jgi:hypothetical protein